MSLSRSPSPVPGGGWSSPGLNYNSGRSSPANANGARPVAWESAKMRNIGANGHQTFATHNQGFFTRHMRRISSSLPRFTDNVHDEKSRFAYANKYLDKIPLMGRVKSIFGRMGRKMKMRLLVLVILICCVIIFYNSRKWTQSDNWLLSSAELQD